VWRRFGREFQTPRVAHRRMPARRDETAPCQSERDKLTPLAPTTIARERE
jgi:hypothetical protein